MNSNYIGYLDCPIGILKIVSSKDNLLEVNFVNDISEENTNDIIDETKKQLTEYFAHKRQFFDLPLKITGTTFQKDCYQALLNIPYGQTITYKEQANLINKPKSYRAVGNANGKNKIAIIIPCHRVISSNNQLGGYTGGIDKKIFLLNHETIFNNY